MKDWMIFFFCLAQIKVFGQVSYGSRLSGMGNSAAAISDPWSMGFNPAGITGIDKFSLSLSYNRHIFAEELSSQGAAFVLPFNKNFAGISLHRYGIPEYNEVRVSAAFARKFGFLSLALGAGYSQIKITGYGNTTGIYIKAGAQYEINDRLNTGIYIDNPAQQKYNSMAQTEIPVLISAGLAYKPTDLLLVAFSLRNDLHPGIGASLGIDYEPVKNIYLRGGLSTRPFRQSGGMGFKFRQASIDVALVKDPHLGFSPQIDIGYAF